MTTLKEDPEEAMTPVRTTSFNGCGVMLVDYRPVADGVYEASRWVTIAGIPIVPLSVWKIRPIKYTQQIGTEKQFFGMLGKSRMTLDRFFRPYLILLIGALPLYLAYKFFDLSAVVYFFSRKIGTWFAVGFIVIMIVLVLVWFGFIMTRIHNADKAYKRKA